MKPSSASRIAAAAIFFFVAAACVFIPRLGMEEDEAIFVPPVYHSGFIGSVSIWGHRLPTMIMSYVGADKTYLYTPILKVFRPTTWSLRLPMVLAGALTLWLLFVATRRLTNDLVAAALVCLIATDPMFLLTTTFDWGPVALQHFFILAAFACLARPKPMVFTAFLALGLALWDKGTAIWIIAALCASAVVFLPRALRANLSAVNFAKAAIGFAIGAFPFLRFNLRNHWATFHDTSTLSTAALPAKFSAIWAMLDGQGLFGWLVRGSAPLCYSLVPLGIAAAVILLFHRKLTTVRPIALFALSTGLLTWLGMLFAEQGGISAHHIILVWPWPHLFAVCVLGYSLSKKPFAALVFTMVLSNMIMLGWYAQRAYTFGPAPYWSDATFGLPGILPPDRRIVAIDWGIANIATFLTRGERRMEEEILSGPKGPDISAIEQTQFLGHVPGEEMISGTNAAFDAAIGKLGLVRVIDHVLADRRGHPSIVSFHCIRAGKPAY